jgi:biopolymer transport protein ExbD
VLIRTEANVCYEAVANVLDTYAGLYIRRTYFSHPDVDDGREIELWLPVGGLMNERIIVKRIILEKEEEKEQKKERKQDEKVEKEQQGAVPEKNEQNLLTERKETSPVSVLISELRVKLFWVDRNNPRKRLSAKEDPEGNAGMLSLKFQDTLYMERNQPDWKGFEETMKSIAGAFKPTKQFPKCPVIIDPMKKVHFADVLRCVVICKKAGMGQITLAVPVE